MRRNAGVITHVFDDDIISVNDDVTEERQAKVHVADESGNLGLGSLEKRLLLGSQEHVNIQEHEQEHWHAHEA